MKKFYFAMLGMALLFSLSAFAAGGDEYLSKDHAVCMDKAGGVTPDMLDCIASEAEQQEKQLNIVYKKVIAGLSKDRQEALKKAQRAWLQYRELYSGYLYNPDGGQIAIINANSWHMSITAARVQELKAEIEP
ncbi:lysozyme inhibitor LprI family protein [Desulfovibrio sp. OttesenSCG-928-F20]|nr:lysozyme inhibitor LprI family protein [Desulfovibrio sp. OttesenSCG-928-F20]